MKKRTLVKMNGTDQVYGIREQSLHSFQNNSKHNIILKTRHAFVFLNINLFARQGIALIKNDIISSLTP